MLDKFLLKFFGAIDTLSEFIVDKIFGKRCKCKKKKNGK